MGSRAAYFDVHSSDNDANDVSIESAGQARFRVVGGQNVTAGFLVKLAPGNTSQKFIVKIEDWINGAYSGTTPNTYTVTTPGWNLLTVTKSMNEAASEGRAFINVRGDGAFWIDAGFAFDSAAPAVDVTKPETFVEADSFVTILRADTLFASGPLHDAAVALGDIPAREERQEITSEADAETYGLAYFQKFLPVMERPDLESFGVIETSDAGDSTATMMPANRSPPLERTRRNFCPRRSV